MSANENAMCKQKCNVFIPSCDHGCTQMASANPIREKHLQFRSSLHLCGLNVSFPPFCLNVFNSVKVLGTE